MNQPGRQHRVTGRGPRFSDHTVVVTGAGQGQGACEARSFADAGAHVVVADVAEDHGQQVAKEIGDRARFARLDVTSEQDWDEMLRGLRWWPPVRTLVNNAGVHWSKPLEDEPPDSFERMLRVNVVGAQIGIRKVTPVLRDTGGGSIVNICSVLALLGSRDSSSYVTSKWALRGLTKASAMELGRYGIRVNAVHPGYVQTPMLKSASGGSRDADYYDYLPLERAGEPSEVADLVMFLASSESRYLTGGDFTVDGGMTAGSGPRSW